MLFGEASSGWLMNISEFAGDVQMYKSSEPHLLATFASLHLQSCIDYFDSLWRMKPPDVNWSRGFIQLNDKFRLGGSYLSLKFWILWCPRARANWLTRSSRAFALWNVRQIKGTHPTRRLTGFTSPLLIKRTGQSDAMNRLETLGPLWSSDARHWTRFSLILLSAQHYDNVSQGKSHLPPTESARTS